MADFPVLLVMQVHFLVVAQLTADHRDFAVAVRAGWFMFLLGRASLVKLAQDLLVGPCTQVHGEG